MILAGEVRGPLVGCDIYHGNMPFSRWFGDFQIHKATEGKTFVDCDYFKWADERSADTLNGAYHFMSVSNDTRAQADNFLDTVRGAALPVVPILDLEGDALAKAIGDPDWVMRWLDYVDRETGKKVWLYTNTNGMNNLSLKVLEGRPIWIASYGKKYPNMGKREFLRNNWICWQFTSTPWDMDIFNGTPETWKEHEWNLKEPEDDWLDKL